MRKLGHMIDDKMRARSIGPYSLIPSSRSAVKRAVRRLAILEMEVWALEAFGAANILQEILTIKSDDVMGRAGLRSHRQGRQPPAGRYPESLNVLLHELRGPALSVKLGKTMPRPPSLSAGTAPAAASGDRPESPGGRKRFSACRII